MDLDMRGVEIQATAIVACWIAICALGIVSNVIQTLLMTCKSERDTSYGVYLTALALADSCVLLIKVSEGAVFLALRDADVSFVRPMWKAWTSSIVTAINVALQCVSSWILVTIAVDRTIVLCFPPQRLALCSRHRALVVTTCFIIMSLILHVPFLGVYLTKTQDMNATISLPRSYVAVMVTNQLPFGSCDAFALWIPRAAVIVQALSSYLVPAAILLPLCVVLIFALMERYQKLHLISMTDRLTAERIQKQNQLAITLLVVLFKFFIFGMPYGVVLLLFYLDPASEIILTGVQGSIPQTVLNVAPRWLVLCSLDILVSLGRASHVWVLFGDAYFRRIFYQLVCADRTSMNASLTQVSVRSREMHSSIDDDTDHISSSRQVVGVRLSSNKSSFRYPGSTETATPDTIRTFEIDMDPSHMPDIRPTEIVLKETANRLSVIVENSKL